MRKFLYLHGFASGPRSRKARFFQDRLAEASHTLEAPDLTAGDFENLTIAGQLAVIEKLAADEPVTLIGSSMGGYLAALYASLHPETERLILLAPAFDLNRRWSSLVGAEAFAEWRRTGRLSVYHYSEGGQRNLNFGVCEESQAWDPRPAFSQPALLFHGRFDTVVPVELSEEYAAAHPNTRLTVLDSDHELIGALPQIWDAAAGFLLP